MEPMGTITQYFPFIDQETKKVLEDHMSEASDYYDFVLKLCGFVLENDSPVMVVYFAIHHAILTYEFKLINNIGEKYGEHQILGPNLCFASVYQGIYEDCQRVRELADTILASQPEKWIELEMQFLKFEVDMRNYPKTMYSTSTFDRIRELIDSDPRFGYYESVLYDYLAIRAHVDGDTDERINCLRKGLENAKKYDDRVYVAYLQIELANVIMNFDRKESRDLLENAYKLVDSSIGTPIYFADIVYYLSILDAIRGDFDIAISRLLDAVNIRERAGSSTANPSYFLSTFYNVIGEPESGLEWGLMTEEQFKGTPMMIDRARMNQIWSLIMLGRKAEAQLLLESNRESIVKSGVESQLAWLHFVTGILEREQGDLTLAISSIEQGLKIYEQQGTAILMELIFSYELAKAEVLSCSEREVVSPSLALLEEKALTEDLPGILGQVLLLKAEIALLNNDHTLLREIIPQLQSLCDQKNLQFLKPHYDRLVNRL
ncbi:MAG: hypothetical protein ACTSU3_10115 [Candidatus Thorarchaeota archaeon]